MMPYCIVLDRRVDLTIPLYVQPSCSPYQQLRPRIPRLASPRLAPPFEARGVSSTPTLKQGGISCGKCKSVCSYQPLKACTVFLSYISIQTVAPHRVRSFYLPDILDILDPFTGAGRHRIRSSRAKTQLATLQSRCVQDVRLTLFTLK